MKIAVLALQGAFAEHEHRLRELDVECFEVRQRSDWDAPKDGLIIPGGESTVMLKLLDELQLFVPIRADLLAGLPVFGTCAGLILLARHVEDEEARQRLAIMDISVRRNAYGRQLGSFHTEAPMAGVGQTVPMTFIRAPYISAVGSGVDVLATVDGHIVAARQDAALVTAFHPELDSDTAVHRYFIHEFVQP